MFQWLTNLFGSVSASRSARAEQATRAADSAASTAQPIAGAENAVPWPMPLIPGAQSLTFWGEGDATTGEFSIGSDASLRIVVETGPFTLRVLRPDGSDAGNVVPVPRGMALGAIPEGGTYRLDVRTTGKWGVTIVFRA